MRSFSWRVIPFDLLYNISLHIFNHIKDEYNQDVIKVKKYIADGVDFDQSLWTKLIIGDYWKLLNYITVDFRKEARKLELSQLGKHMSHPTELGRSEEYVASKLWAIEPHLDRSECSAPRLNSYEWMSSPNWFTGLTYWADINLMQWIIIR